MNQIHYTKSDHHVSRYSFKGEHQMGIISTIWLMLNLSVRVPRPCLHMLGLPSKNLSINVCKTVLHPRYACGFKYTRSSRDVLKRWNIVGAYLRKNTFLSWYLNEGSSYYANKTPNKQYKMQQTSYVKSEMPWSLHLIVIMCIVVWSSSFLYV